VSDARFWIDTSRCTGCAACLIACQDRAGLGDAITWLRVVSHEEGTFPQVRVVFEIVHCWHCKEPSCVEVCPVEALVKTSEGWVSLASKACIGCGACIEACPYECLQMSKADVVRKCDGCADLVAHGHIPVCVNACPTRALGYGAPPARPASVAVDTAYDLGTRPRVDRLIRR